MMDWGFWIENSKIIKAYFAIFFIFLILERLWNTFSRKKKNSIKPSLKTYHRKFFYLLLFCYLIIILQNVSYFFFLNQLNVYISLIGLFILAFGIIDRRLSIRNLGEYWSLFIEIKTDQKLVRTGPYKYFKHPYYLAVVLELLGFSLLCNSIIGVLLTIFLQMPLLARYDRKLWSGS